MRLRIDCRARDFDANALAARAHAAGTRALAMAAEFARARSAAIAPRRSGALVASARVVTESSGVELRYGAPYAAIQHERADFRHPGGGRAGYLRAVAEDPATARAAERMLAAELRANL